LNLAKIRINKLALELNVQNDQIIDELKKQGHTVKNHMSSIDEDVASLVRSFFSDEPVAPAKTASKTKKAATKATTKKKTAKAKTPAKKAVKAKAAAKDTETEKTRAALKTVPKESEASPGKTAQPKSSKQAPNKAAPTSHKEDTDPDKHKAGRKLGLKIVKKDEEQEKEAAAQDKSKPKAPDTKKKEDKSAPPPQHKKPAAEKEPEQAPVAVAEDEAFETVQLTENMAIRDLGEKLNCTANDILKDLMQLGVMATINQSLSFELSEKIADLRGYEVEKVTAEAELGFDEEEEELDAETDRILRAPIVTIMGHVDHGKTSLLDAIRETNVTGSEKGGITQHIGAYQAMINNKPITFLDTPGHEAFTAMRARGAQVTDIVVLVVAADDGIKPQTLEAIHHANAGNVPLVVAINKIDKPDAKPEEVKKQLADQGLIPEEWGGSTIFTEVSALQRTGLDHLLELLLLQAEVMELKSNSKVRARGTVIESHLDKGRGPVATLLVQKGVLKVGDPFIVGNFFGKVRALINHKGKKVHEAGVAMPVEVVGIPEVPEPGDKFMVVKDEKRARQLSTMKIQRQRETVLSQKPRITMEDLHQQIVDGIIQELNLIVKADVQGSIEAVREASAKLETDKVRVRIIHDAVGGISESDVLLASASNAVIIGFNVRPTEQAQTMAEKDQVDIRMYSIIYDAIDDMKKAMEGLLEPTFKEKIMGRAEVREVFTMPKIGVIAGCHVLSGILERNSRARLLRDSVVVYEGKIQSLRRFKEDVKEVASGYECGLALDKYQDVKQGDIVEPFVMEEVAPSPL